VPSRIFFVPVKDGVAKEALADSTARLFDKAGVAKTLSSGDFVAIKVHFGEGSNTNIVPPSAPGSWQRR